MTRRGRRSAAADVERAEKRARLEQERQEQQEQEQKNQQASSAGEKDRAPDTGGGGNAHQASQGPTAPQR